MSDGPAALPFRLRLVFLRSHIACKRPRRTTIFVVPWVNVVLLLFAFYIVQSKRLLSPGLMLSLPAAPFAGGAQSGSEVVTVLRSGAIFFHDEHVAIENLAATLRKTPAASASGTLLIEADGDVTHKLLAAVYSAAQSAAYTNVVLATRLPDANGAPGSR